MGDLGGTRNANQCDNNDMALKKAITAAKKKLVLMVPFYPILGHK